jgi:hypothetical protein
MCSTNLILDLPQKSKNLQVNGLGISNQQTELITTALVVLGGRSSGNMSLLQFFFSLQLFKLNR